MGLVLHGEGVALNLVVILSLRRHANPLLQRSDAIIHTGAALLCTEPHAQHNFTLRTEILCQCRFVQQITPSLPKLMRTAVGQQHGHTPDRRQV